MNIKCPICGKEFDSIKSLTTHLETHEKENSEVRDKALQEIVKQYNDLKAAINSFNKEYGSY